MDKNKQYDNRQEWNVSLPCVSLFCFMQAECIKNTEFYRGMQAECIKNTEFYRGMQAECIKNTEFYTTEVNL